MLKIVPFKKEHIEQIETRYHFPDAAKVAFTSDNSMVAYTGMMGEQDIRSRWRVSIMAGRC